jgi:cellulose synthase/poly-beta-1,6-N-acetylglucosamine synthase-like glycosyltransferase
MLHAQGKLVLCVDSDSKLHPQALRNAVHHFADPKVAAVGGYVSIVNDNNYVTRMQQLEYAIGLNFVRRCLSYFNIVSVVPGPVGLFRVDAIRQLGGYSTSGECFAEDADLTVRLLVNGWRVKGETNMIAYTEAPDTMYSLLRQRYRWKRGIFQAWYDNVARLVFSRKARNIPVAGILMFESFLFDIINFGITVFGIAGFLAFAEFKVFIWVFALLLSLDVIVFIFVYAGRKKLLHWFSMFLLSKITYAYILQAWGVFALFDEFLATKMSWDKLDRIGSLS